MASITLGVGQTFPDGTTVGAYPASAWSGRYASGAPLGSATSSQSVTNSSVTFTGLTADTDYYAAGSVSGTYRYVQFHVPANAPGLELGYAEITSTYTRTGAGIDDVPGLSVTVTVGTRPIVIEFGAGGVWNTAAGGLTVVSIMEGATALTAATLGVGPGASVQIPVTRRVRLAPSAGSHTYKITLQQAITGNSAIGGAATNPAYIQVTEV